MEFCAKDTAFWVTFDQCTGTAYVNQPLGLSALFALLGAVAILPAFMMRAWYYRGEMPRWSFARCVDANNCVFRGVVDERGERRHAKTRVLAEE